MSSDRIAGLGNQLVEVHIWLREQLDALPSGAAVSDLRAHCIAFCGAVSRHHTDEDGTVFPRLALEHPSLRPVLDELRRDHELIAEILVRIAETTDRAELDGLAALLESHFTYEERRLVAALNALEDGPEVFAQQLAEPKIIVGLTGLNRPAGPSQSDNDQGRWVPDRPSST